MKDQIRTKMTSILAAGLLALLLPAAGLQAQQDGQQRRQGEDEDTWTNEDLKALEAGGVSYLGAGSYTGEMEKPREGYPREWWERRAQLYGDRLADVEGRLEDLRKRLGRAVNPYTRAMAGTVKTEGGEERLATPADLRSEIARLEQVREAEMRGLATLEETARRQGVPESWLEPEGSRSRPQVDRQPPLFIDPKNRMREEGSRQPPLYVDPRRQAPGVEEPVPVDEEQVGADEDR